MTIVDRKGEASRFDCGPEDVAFTPQGFGHYVENIGDGEAYVMVVHNHAEFTTIELSEWVAGGSLAMFASTLNMSAEAFAEAPRNGSSSGRNGNKRAGKRRRSSFAVLGFDGDVGEDVGLEKSVAQLMCVFARQPVSRNKSRAVVRKCKRRDRCVRADSIRRSRGIVSPAAAADQMAQFASSFALEQDAAREQNGTNENAGLASKGLALRTNRNGRCADNLVGLRPARSARQPIQGDDYGHPQESANSVPPPPSTARQLNVGRSPKLGEHYAATLGQYGDEGLGKQVRQGLRVEFAAGTATPTPRSRLVEPRANPQIRRLRTICS